MSRTNGTESRHDGLPWLDTLDTLPLLQLMNDFDIQVPLQVGKALESIARAVDLAVASLQAGGRLIYIGAGTSGRIAVADAAEIGPTFGFDRIEAIMAGGPQAIIRPSEVGEDNRQAGKEALLALNISSDDTVLGISANGGTPFVRAALDCARERRASTVLLSGNAVDDFEGDCLIFVDTGQEIVRGSTRLKAGTAAKLVLNMISTASMIKIGRVVANEMLFMKAANAKLTHRAALMLSDILGIDEIEAAAAVRRAEGSPAAAILMHLRGCTLQEALSDMQSDPLAVRKAWQASVS